jgi:hypothetical protein
MKTATVIGAALTVLSLTSVPALAEVNKFQFRGNNVSAFFSKEDGCIATFIDVSAFENISKSNTTTKPGAPISETRAFLSYSSFDFCNFTTIFSFFGETINPTLKINNSLQSATLNATVPVFDFTSGTTRTAVVNLAWQATSEPVRSNFSSSFQSSNILSRSRSRSTSRDAQVTGDVTLDGKKLNEGLNSFGFIGSSSSGSLEIFKRN